MNHKNMIKCFLNTWLNWVDSGAEKHRLFDRSTGLCSSLQRMMCDMEIFTATEISVTAHEFYIMLDRQRTPFDCEVQEITYASECDKREMHLNPKRLAWARSKLKELSQ